MSRVCEVCGKKPLKANKICFSHKAHRYHQQPNIQSVKAVTEGGAVKRMKVCTSCLKADKVTKAR